MIARDAHLGVALLRTVAHRPAAPLKLNLCLTYWCQYKCKTCNIWQLVRENPNINWVDLTGGEIFLRRDIDEVFDAIVTGWSRLALLHFPTNGFQTDRIVRSVERGGSRSRARPLLTVDVEGGEEHNEQISGI